MLPPTSHRYEKAEFDTLHEFDKLYFGGSFEHNLVCGIPEFSYTNGIQKAVSDYSSIGSFRYSRVDGHASFRAAISQILMLSDGFSFIATAGGTGGILLSLLATMDSGSEVIVFDPDFAAYRHLIEFLGGKSVPNFVLHASGANFDFSSLVNCNTRAVIFSNPSNPMGTVIAENEMRALVDMAGKLGIWVIIDEAYAAYIHSNNAFFSAVELNQEHVITVRSLSKSHGLGGLRIGYVVGHERVISVMRDIQEYSFICPSVISQLMAAVAIDEGAICTSDYVRSIEIAMEKFLQHGIAFVKPAATFFLCVMSPLKSGADFARLCYEKGLAVLPGSFFSQRDNFVRLSFARTSAENQRAVDAFIEIYKSACTVPLVPDHLRIGD